MSEYLIKKPVTVEMQDGLEKVYHLIFDEGFSHLPVVEDDKLVGIVNKSDFTCRYLKLLNVEKQVTSEIGPMTVRDIVNRDPITILDSSTLDSALKMFIDNDVHALVVVDQDKRLKGLLYSFDLLDRNLKHYK